MNLQIVVTILLQLFPISVLSGPHSYALVGFSEEDKRLVSLDSYPYATRMQKEDRLQRFLEIAPWNPHRQSLRHQQWMMHRRLFGGDDDGGGEDCPADEKRKCICNCTCNESSNGKLRMLFGGDTNSSTAADDGSTNNYCSMDDSNDPVGNSTSNRSLRILYGTDEGNSNSNNNNVTETDYCAGQSNQTRRFLFGGDGEEEDETGAGENGICACSSEEDSEASNGGVRLRVLFGGDDVDEDGCSQTSVEDNWGTNSKYDWEIPPRIQVYTACFSLFGSIWIIVEVLRDSKKRRLVYHRIVFALSCFDVTLSICYLVTPVLVANGFDGKCGISGVFTYWASLCIPVYNAILGGYFLLSVKFGWPEHRIQKHFERYVHVLIPLVTMLLSIPPMTMNLYNGYYHYCFVTYAGEGRGTEDQSDIFQGIFFTTVGVSTVALTVCMGLLYCKIRSTVMKGRRWSFNTTNQDMLLHRVRTMAILYTIPFYLTWVIPTVWQIVVKIQWKDVVAGRQPRIVVTPLTSYVMQIWMATFLPLQGFFNWVIYMRSRFQFLQDIGLSCHLSLVKMFTRVCCKLHRNSTDNEDNNEDDADGNNIDDDESMIGSWVRSMEERLTSTEEMAFPASREMVCLDEERVLSA